MEADKLAFSERMAAVFGALGSDSGLASGWQVSESEVVFKGGEVGSEEEHMEEADSDGEAVELRGQVPGDEDGDGEDALGEEEEDVKFRKSASIAFCSGLDREQEMDDYDDMATGTMAAASAKCPDARPPSDTEVLEGNFYETRCVKGEGRQAAASAGEASSSFLAAEGQRCRAAARGSVDAAHQLGAEPRRWNFLSSIDPEKPTGATHEGSGDVIRWTAAKGEGTEEGGRDAGGAPRRGGQPVVWAAQGGGQNSGGEPPTGGNPTQGKEKRPRVRFADDVVERDENRGATCGRSFPRGGRSALRRGSRQSRVPDHVRNPDKWTCYTLDEPIMVGGGGGGDTTVGLEMLPAPDAHRAADVSSHEVGEAEGAGQAPLPLPGEQGIKFVPRKERETKATTPVAPPVAAKAKKAKRVATGALACAATADDVMEVDDSASGERDTELRSEAKQKGNRRFRGK